MTRQLTCVVGFLFIRAALAWQVGVAQDNTAFQELFGDEAAKVAASATKKDDVEFAAKLLDAAKSLKENKELRTQLYRKAHEFGTKDVAGYSTAIAALELFGKDSPERATACQEAALTLQEKLLQAAKPADRKTLALPYVQRVLAVADSRVADKKTSEAIALLRKVGSAAVLSGTDSALMLQEKAKLLVERQQAEKKLAELYEKLFRNKDDLESLQEVLRLLLVDLDNPAEAQKLAEHVKDEALARLLKTLSREPATWTADEAGQVAAWFEEQAKHASPTGQRVALDNAQQAIEQQLAAYRGEEVVKLKIKLSAERIAKALEALDAKTSTAAKAAVSARKGRKKYLPGLVLRVYARHESQADADLGKGWVPPEELGKPVAPPVLISTLTPLKQPLANNVVATGYLKIDEPGEYAFNANAEYDRCALYLNGELVCPFRDGEEKIAKVMLEKGMVPIQVAVMCGREGNCTIKWQPPGAPELGPIPSNLMFYIAE